MYLNYFKYPNALQAFIETKDITDNFSNYYSFKVHVINNMFHALLHMMPEVCEKLFYVSNLGEVN